MHGACMASQRHDDRTRLAGIDWSRFETAYGPARKVPGWLLDFVHANGARARRAGHQLWCSLCHQHAYVSSAALPALPWIVAVLQRTDEQLVCEALDILLGFVRCTDPGQVQQADGVAPAWHRELRDGVRRVLPEVTRLLASGSPEVAEAARALVDELGPSEG